MPKQTKLERDFQAKLILDIRKRLPGCIVTKVNTLQGLPDLLILYNDKWAMLECKRSPNAAHQPNQDYYVKKLDSMSFSRFIFPENATEVLDELQQSLQSERPTRLSRRQ